MLPQLNDGTKKIEPNYEKNNQSIYVGDCLELLKNIPSNSVNLVFADPPYNIGKKFGNNKDQWDTPEAYFKWCEEWIRECIRILKKDGSIFIMGHPKYIPGLMKILDGYDLYFINQIIYHYTDGMPEKKCFEHRYEPILYYRKNPDNCVFNLDAVRVEPTRFDKFSNPKGKNPGDVWQIHRVRWNSKERVVDRDGKIAHCAQKPIKLLDRIILATTNPSDVVLDPFLGTGTTLVSSLKNSRNGIGFELNPDYAKMAISRLGDQFGTKELEKDEIEKNIIKIQEQHNKIDEWFIPRDRVNFYLTHDFHPYFAAFPPELAKRLILAYSKEEQTVLDPFCGGGSAVVEAVANNRVAMGSDISPLAVLISRVKATPIAIDTTELNSFLQRIESRCSAHKSEKENTPLTSNEFIHKWFSKDTVTELTIIKEEILNVPEVSLREFLLVAFSSIVRKVSYAKNAQQHLCREKNKKIKSAISLFIEKVRLMASQMPQFRESVKKYSLKTFEADVRNISKYVDDETIDLIVTSPPYGTGSRYTDINRLSFEWLDLPLPKRAETLECNKDFEKQLEKGISEMYDVLKPNKYLCLVYGDPSKENGLTSAAIRDAKQIGFSYKGLVSCPIEKVEANHHTKYRRFIPKDFILILQK